jgi:hypothetical protein
MPRNELSPAAQAELEALDAILARTPVGEEHLELAALVDSVRGDAPRIDPAFATQLEARVRARFRRPSRRRAPRIAWPAAAGSLVALALGALVLVSSGVLNGTKTQPDELVPTTTVAPRSASTGGAFKPATRSAGSALQASTGPLAALAAPGAAGGGASLNPGSRLVSRASSLTLVATAGRIQTVANAVVASTEHAGGIVESSSVTVLGLASHASFKLRVPSSKLGGLISSLSSLAGVLSLNQATTDITNSYNRAQAKLAAERAERSALIKALAAATTLTQQQRIEAEITALDGKIALATDRVQALAAKGHNATVSVDVRTAAAGASSGRSGPLGRALDDSLAVLDVALVIALVAFAIFLPIALCGLAVWWSAATLRQRARERAFAASAT